MTEFPSQMIWFAELVGTVAFAISGATVAVSKKMDIFGVFVLGLTTAVGGGIVRDLILGITPPYVFRNAFYVIVSTCSILLFALFYILVARRWKRYLRMKYYYLLSITDAVGLGIFTVIGVNAAIQAGFGQNHFLLVFVGVMTGVGGGILRDMMAGDIPQVLRKRVYAVASIAGAFAYAILQLWLPDLVAMTIGAGLVIAIRMIAIVQRWHLPVLTD